MTSAEYRQALDALPYGKRLPGAVYLNAFGDDTRIPSLLRITVATLRKRLKFGPEFNPGAFIAEWWAKRLPDLPLSTLPVVQPATQAG